MESKQEFTEEKNSDIEILKSIVEMVMSVDLMANNRKRCVVESRMIYAYILREINYSLNRIGMSLKKDHTTVIHYIATLRKLIQTDTEILSKYSKCRDLFMNERHPENIDNKEGFINKVLSLSNKVDVLMVENERLKNDNKKIKEQIIIDDKRLNRIVKFIDENTPIGHEFIVERKIRKMFDE